MGETHVLPGAEQVLSASHTMYEAASNFSRHISYLDDVLLRHRQGMEDLVTRFEEAAKLLKGNQ